MRWAVLVGGAGTNLRAIVEYGFPVSLVISHRKRAGALAIAAEFGLPAEIIAPSAYPDRGAYDQALRAVLGAYRIDAMALAGFMRWLHPETIAAFRNRIVNIHPSLLPAFPGLHAIERAYAHGVRWTGVTIHFVDEGEDTGPIIAQLPVPRQRDDTLDALAERIHRAEHGLYPRILSALDRGEVVVEAAPEAERPRVLWKGAHSAWSIGHF
ncbi:MAG: phosphoribosylglycinamide formyltransferase [Thermaerobacter sp.]|nr:phosphoribosylglycinamide formyltransferase [Thermaerobacter sp.]